MSATVASRRLVSIAEAADYAHVHPRTIRRRISDDTIPGRRLGPRTSLVDLNELDAALRRIPTAAGER
jgi:excisionase family DNA binding protein